MPFQDRWGHVCGFLNYEEKENSGRFTRRYFIISNQERALLGYYDSPANLPEGSLPSIRISLAIISHARDVSKQRPKIELCFVISTPERNHYFQADSQEDKDDWIAKVTSACKVTVPSKAPKSPTHTSGEAKGDQTSYKTEIVGGVVMRTPVNQPPPTSGTHHMTPMSDSDSDTEENQPDRRSLPPMGQQSTEAPSSKYIVEGWCVKQGAVRKNWKRRYFALSDHGVSYFKSENDKVPIKTISLAEIVNCKASGQWSALQRDNLFEINCYARTFFVQAYTPQEMERWINAINSWIENSKDGTNYEAEDTHL